MNEMKNKLELHDKTNHVKRKRTDKRMKNNEEFRRFTIQNTYVQGIN